MNDHVNSFTSLVTSPALMLQYLQEHRWLLLLVIGAPCIVLILVAIWRKSYPRISLAILLLIPISVSLAVLRWPEVFWIVLFLDALIVLVALIDFLTIPTVKSISVDRSVMRIASIKQNHKVTLTISNVSRRPITVWIRDDVPQEFTPNPKQFVVNLAPQSRSTVHYEMKASRRGAFRMNRVYSRVRSKLGLWQTFLKCPQPSLVHVYPDMKQLAEYAILARTNRLSLMGVRRTRKIGQDNEFERLRDYTRDDNYRNIDWRSTARRNKLTVKDFQTNQSQRIIFLVDCGRMMTNESSGISLLDHSLNAMLMMSYVALNQGDSVGLICFSDQIHTFVPPRSGLKQMNQLLHASFDRFPQLVESRYDQAFLYLRTHCTKRSLVVLVTNIIDEVNAHQLHQYLSALVGRHLPLGVLLRDHHLFDTADREPRQPGDIYRAAAAAEILTWRHQVLTDLEHQGVLSVDAFPEDLTSRLVNRYLEIKARHLL